MGNTIKLWYDTGRRAIIHRTAGASEVDGVYLKTRIKSSQQTHGDKRQPDPLHKKGQGAPNVYIRKTLASQHRVKHKRSNTEAEKKKQQMCY